MKTKVGKEILFIQSAPAVVLHPPLSLAATQAYVSREQINTRVIDFNIRLFRAVPEIYHYLWSPQYFNVWHDSSSFLQEKIWEPYALPLLDTHIFENVAFICFFVQKACPTWLLKRMISQLRVKAKSAKIVLVGEGCSSLVFRQTLAASIPGHIDYFIVGDCEEPLRTLFKNETAGFNDKALSQYGILRGTDGACSIDLFVCKNINELPVPSFEGFDLSVYGHKGMLPIELARAVAQDNSEAMMSRIKKPDTIIRHMRTYKEIYGMQAAILYGTAFSKEEKTFESLCDLLIQEDLAVEISITFSPLSEVQHSTIEKMAQAGVKTSFFPLYYTGDDYQTCLSRASSLIQKAFTCGIQTVVGCVVGLLGKTEEDFHSLQNFIVENKSKITALSFIAKAHHSAFMPILFTHDLCFEPSIEIRTKEAAREKELMKTAIKNRVPLLDTCISSQGKAHFSPLKRLRSLFSDERENHKVLLLNLPWRDGDRKGVRAGSRWPHLKDPSEKEYLPFPFFLAYATALLKKNNITAYLLDALAEDYDLEETISFVESYQPETIVIETSTVTLAHDIACAARLADKHTVIFVGPETQLGQAHFLMESPHIDYAITGEYEWTLLELVKARISGGNVTAIPGLSFRTDTGVICNPQGPLLELDALPWPERQTIPIFAYHDTPGDIPQPSVQMLASRGCPYGCIFCLWPNVLYGGRNYRNRSYIDVVDEMEYLVQQGFKSIYFDDDTFGLDKQWVLDFCDEIIRRNKEGRINVPWAMMTRADRLDRQMLDSLKKAGLAAVKYGVETASPDILRLAGKEYDGQHLEQIIYLSKQLDIKVHLTFTFGLPGETERSAKDSTYYAYHLDPESVQFSVVTPFPGTPYYEYAKAHDLLVSNDLSKFDGNYNAVIKTTYLSSEELVAFKNQAYYFWGMLVRARKWGKSIHSFVRCCICWHLIGYEKMQKIHFRGVRKPQAQVRKMVHVIKSAFLTKLRYVGIFHGTRAFFGPQLVQIDLTNDCNNDCIGCWCNSPLLGDRRLNGDQKKERIPHELTIKLIDDIFSMGTTEIYLAGGGEPFMYPEIMEVIEYIKTRGMCLYINTNFTLVDILKVQALVHYAVDHLTVSIWAGTPAMYKKTHPNKDPETFIRLENMLKYLQSIKKHGRPPYVKIYNVISNLNYKELDHMYDFALRTKSESIEFTVLDAIPGHTDSLMLNSEQMRHVHESAVKLHKKYQLLCQKGHHPPIIFKFDQFLRRVSGQDCLNGEYDKNIIDTIPCSIGWTFARVIASGDVNGCLKAHRIPTGNIKHESFRSIWNSPKQQYFREKTFVQKKEGPFFAKIGNDENAAIGCYKGCDDLGRNEHIDHTIRAMSKIEMGTLKGIAAFLRWFDRVRNHFQKKDLQIEINTKSANDMYKQFLEAVPDLEIRGIVDTYYAFKGPTHVVIDITNKCRNSCLACWMYSPFIKKEKSLSAQLAQELPESVVFHLIDDLKKMHSEIIRFTGGGEPLLHRSCGEFMHKAKRAGLKVSLTTSLPKVSDAVISVLGDVDELAVSVWAGDSKTYQRMHPNQPQDQFAYIRETIRSISHNGNSFQLLTIANVLTNQNFDTVDEMISFAQDVGAQKIYFTLVDPIAGSTDKMLLSEKERAWLEAYFEKLDDRRLRSLIIDNYDGFLCRLRKPETVITGNYDGSVIDDVPCYMGWHFTRILANGDVVPCCRGVKKIMGNIMKERFPVIWNNPKQQEFRNKALRLSKYHSYFDDIQCYKTCDNLMHNRMIHDRYVNMSPK